MSTKENKILVSFDSTTNALALENVCKKMNIPGRLIPLPKEISAGCGIAWISPIQFESKLNSAIKDNKIAIKEAIHFNCL